MIYNNTIIQAEEAAARLRKILEEFKELYKVLERENFYVYFDKVHPSCYDIIDANRMIFRTISNAKLKVTKTHEY